MRGAVLKHEAAPCSRSVLASIDSTIERLPIGVAPEQPEQGLEALDNLLVSAEREIVAAFRGVADPAALAAAVAADLKPYKDRLTKPQLLEMAELLERRAVQKMFGLPALGLSWFD